MTKQGKLSRYAKKKVEQKVRKKTRKTCVENGVENLHPRGTMGVK